MPSSFNAKLKSKVHQQIFKIVEFARKTSGYRGHLSKHLYHQVRCLPGTGSQPLILNPARTTRREDPHRAIEDDDIVRHSNLFGTDAKIDELTVQPNRYRIRVGSHIDCAAATDASVLDDVVGVEHCVGQSRQMSKVIKKHLSAVHVGLF